jgi:ABC-2 type transport system permease protein
VITSARRLALWLRPSTMAGTPGRTLEEYCMGSPFVAMWRTRSIQWLLIRRELKVRYGASKLGYFWTILDPLATCLVFWLIFGVIISGARGGGPEPYIVFLVAGYLPWIVINGSIGSSSKAISKESKLVRSSSLPRELWVLRIVGAKSIELILSIPVLLGFLIIFHDQVGFGRGVVYLPLAFLLMVMSLTGIGLMLSTLTVIYKDLERFVKIFMRLLFYMTPILYPSSRVTDELAGNPNLDWLVEVYFLNPFVTIIDLYRTALWSEEFPGWDHVATTSGICVGLLVIGMFVFRRLEGAVLKEI